MLGEERQSRMHDSKWACEMGLKNLSSNSIQFLSEREPEIKCNVSPAYGIDIKDFITDEPSWCFIERVFFELTHFVRSISAIRRRRELGFEAFKL